ncbi:MAG: 16S rRNA (cytosine(1402)-N(4))-methyltransferase [Proteobacteria bacterium]|nr:MAG: 16S rRNA (cytosine(1402)-N(4))-methyltransferase [Pseudomonadota bacterium]
MERPLDQTVIHRPVLLDEAVSMLRVSAGGVYMDGTLGLGGHTREILRRSAPDGRVVAFEWDEMAIEQAIINVGEYRSRLTVVRRNFAEIDQGLQDVGRDRVDGILIDIGLSSLQLDYGERGFSFKADEPLDMRMDRRRKTTAADILASARERELADIFYYYGEEKQSRRIAAAIIEARKKVPLRRAGQLAELVARAIPAKYHPPRIHVATKVFQALRIAVNEELKNLATILDKAADHLTVGGRICVISFHSLEDRIVKRKLIENEQFSPVTKKTISPTEAEIRQNPRSRSARLRVAELLLS